MNATRVVTVFAIATVLFFVPVANANAQELKQTEIEKVESEKIVDNLRAKPLLNEPCTFFARAVGGQRLASSYTYNDSVMPYALTKAEIEKLRISALWDFTAIRLKILDEAVKTSDLAIKPIECKVTLYRTTYVMSYRDIYDLAKDIENDIIQDYNTELFTHDPDVFSPTVSKTYRLGQLKAAFMAYGRREGPVLGKVCFGGDRTPVLSDIATSNRFFACERLHDLLINPLYRLTPSELDLNGAWAAYILNKEYSSDLYK